jgi:hypothetical protein
LAVTVRVLGVHVSLIKRRADPDPGLDPGDSGVSAPISGET